MYCFSSCFCWNRVIWLWVMWMALGLRAEAQQLGAVRYFSRELVLTADTTLLDSLPIVASDFQINALDSVKISRSDFKLLSGRLVVAKKLLGLRVRVRYRVLGLQVFGVQRRYRAKRATSEVPFIEQKNSEGVFVYNPNETANTGVLSSLQGLDYSGNFVRGISIGNNQSAVLNSSFNLQLNGMLGDDIEIVAALTDQNIPVQPEGNTQRIQDFDKIFIQIKKGKTQLTAGDYELMRPNKAYFMNYQKKLQGATLQSQWVTPDSGLLKLNTSVAVTRGKFTRNVVQGKEGNQGPYRLTGAENELFIIILSGTERVFIDGLLMQRGADKDYVIDYNLGELVFTTKRQITKDSRMQIEFNYVEQTYTRTVWAANADYETKNKKLALHIHAFSEQDAKNQPAQGLLSDKEKDALTAAGDNPLSAFVPRIDTLAGGFNSTRVMYRLIDSLVGGLRYDSVLVYSIDPQRAKHVATFSFVGNGNGNYVQTETSANGRVYRWVAPINGVRQGSFMPIAPLIAPKRRTLYTLGAEYEPFKNNKIQVDAALSDTDLNLFSPLGDADNLGKGLFLNYSGAFPLNKKTDSTATTFLVKSSYEYVDARFRSIEPYRFREFTRDWNYTTTTQSTQEQLLKAELGLISKYGKIQYELATLQRTGLYNGLKHLFTLDKTLNGFGINSVVSYLTAENTNTKTLFFRPMVNLTKRLFSKEKQLEIGVGYEQELNQQRNLIGDSLSPQSFNFVILKSWIAKEGTKFGASLNATNRKDYHIVSNQFRLLSNANNFKLEGRFTPNANLRVVTNLTYRQLEVPESTSTLEPINSFLGRIEYNHNLAKGFLNLNSVYELGNGQQRKLEYTYLRVNVGEGSYIWIDRNADNIPQINEFETAPYKDQANFQRVLSTTNLYIPTQNLGFNLSLSLTPKRLFKKNVSNSFLKLVEKTSSQSLFRVDRRIQSSADYNLILNPLADNIPDTSLVSLGTNIRNTLYFNRSDSKFGLEFWQQQNSNKTALTTGAEARNTEEYGNKFRWNFTSQLGFFNTFAIGERSNTSQNFSERNYQLTSLQNEIKLQYTYQQHFRISLEYKYKQLNNQIGSKEQLTSHDIGSELSLNRSAKSDLRASFHWVGVEFTGTASNAVGFQMLEGLQTGTNLLWQLNYRQNLSQTLELSLGYEGRKTGQQGNLIHIGRAQLRANF